LIKGNWVSGDGHGGGDGVSKGKFEPDEEGTDLAIRISNKAQKEQQARKQRHGLIVMMTDDENSPVKPDEYGEFEEPVIDRFLRTDGLILINVRNPIIAKSRERKEYQHIFNERVANYVLLVVAQFQAQRELDIQPEDERDDPMIVFRQRFFKLQRELREDKEITYFDEDAQVVN
jgi:hypothetical protein